MTIVLLRILLLALVLGPLAGCEQSTSHAQPAAAGPPPVSVAPVVRRQVEEFDEFSARLEAVDQVEVRARVPRTLERVHFRDGQSVSRDALLFTIDPRPYAAEVARTGASLASARTQAALARTELARADQLLPLRAISQQEADRLRAAANNGASAV